MHMVVAFGLKARLAGAVRFISPCLSLNVRVASKACGNCCNSHTEIINILMSIRHPLHCLDGLLASAGIIRFFTDQQVEETKAALRELGMNDEVQTH